VFHFNLVHCHSNNRVSVSRLNVNHGHSLINLRIKGISRMSSTSNSTNITANKKYCNSKKLANRSVSNPDSKLLVLALEDSFVSLREA